MVQPKVSTETGLQINITVEKAFATTVASPRFSTMLNIAQLVFHSMKEETATSVMWLVLLRYANVFLEDEYIFSLTYLLLCYVAAFSANVNV